MEKFDIAVENRWIYSAPDMEITFFLRFHSLVLGDLAVSFENWHQLTPLLRFLMNLWAGCLICVTLQQGMQKSPNALPSRTVALFCYCRNWKWLSLFFFNFISYFPCTIVALSRRPTNFLKDITGTLCTTGFRDQNPSTNVFNKHIIVRNFAIALPDCVTLISVSFPEASFTNSSHTWFWLLVR